MQLFSGLIKYILFAFNFIIAVGSLILIGIGSVLIVNENKGLDSFTDFSVGGFAIGVGILIFIIAFFGCFGALKENSCLLTTYAIILITLLILQIVLAALAFVVLNNDDGALDTKIMDIVQNIFDDFYNNQEFDKIDVIQQHFECCGPSGSKYYTDDHDRPIFPSCCPDNDCYNNAPYQDGCAMAFKNFISYHIEVIGGISLAFGVIELAGAVFAFIVRNRDL